MFNKQQADLWSYCTKIPSLNRVTSAGIGLSDYLELTLGFYLWVREELMNSAIILDKSRCETS